MNSYDVEWYHHLPPHVKEILRRLHEAGRQAFVVGGAVRDLWLGVEPKDYDLVSEATPEEIESLFPKTLSLGRAFGIMVVVTDSGPVEIARFRADGAYTDSRHPDEILFAEPEQDAKRRDFTINGLFYDTRAGKVIDYVDGVPDLKAHMIRAVGDPALRFQEDTLRMLRALRFHAQLGDFSLEENLREAIRTQSSRIKLVSRERITQEISRILASAHISKGLLGLVDVELWTPIFQTPPPAAEILARLDTLSALQSSHFGADAAADISLYFAALSVWIPDFDPEKCFLLGRETKTKLAAILPLVPRLKEIPRLDLAAKKALVGAPEFLAAWSIFSVTEKTSAPWLEELLVWRTQKEKEGSLRPAPLLKGADLLALGVKPGPEVKGLLEAVRTAQLNEEISSQDEALALARSLINP